MVENVKFLNAKVGHRRLRPKKNQFLYKLFYVQIPVIHNQKEIKLPRIMSCNRFNILSIYTKDQGAKNKNISWHDFVAKELNKINYQLKDNDKIFLICHPRIFGYVFNPISYWLVIDNNSNLKIIICEVHNTFGDNHNYLLYKENLESIEHEDTLFAEKKLYVSPFNPMSGSYKFKLRFDPKNTFKSNIDYFENGNLTVETFMFGSQLEASTTNGLKLIFRYPFMTIVVVARIHWQAVKLLFKKVPHTLKDRPRNYKNNTTTINKNEATSKQKKH